MPERKMPPHGSQKPFRTAVWSRNIGLWFTALRRNPAIGRIFCGKTAAKTKSLLEFQRLIGGERSLVHIRLHTGRSHQIRVQFSSRGYPLVGDHKYGARDDHDAPLLFSCRLTFPYRGKTVTYEHYPQWGKTE